MTDLPELQIAKLNLQPGDILVVKTPARHSGGGWENILPPGVRVLYIPPETELSVLTRAEIEARAA